MRDDGCKVIVRLVVYPYMRGLKSPVNDVNEDATLLVNIIFKVYWQYRFILSGVLVVITNGSVIG